MGELVLRPYQAEAIEKLRQSVRNGHKKVALQSPTGCLVGDTKLVINRGGCARPTMLSTVVSRLNGEEPLGRGGKRVRWDLTIPTYTQSIDDGGYSRLNQVMSVHDNGQADVVEIGIDDGRSIIATESHRFMVHGDEWVRLHELRENDLVLLLDWPQSQSRQCKKRDYYRQVLHMNNHPFRQQTNSGRDGVLSRVPYHRLVAEARENGITVEELIGRVILNRLDGLVLFDPRKIHVHHKNEDISDNRSDNLEALPAVEHLRQHGQRGGWKNVAGRVVEKRVKHLVSRGRERVYDLTMNAPMQNYVANEFVVHNSGKTEMAMSLIEEALAKGSKTAFIVDRLSILYQTEERFDRHGFDFGVLQAGHYRFRPQEKLQLCSSQTLARRGFMNDFNLVVVDENHTLYKSTVEFLKRHPDLIAIGLSATNFTKGLGTVYSDVVNAETTDKLIEMGFLVPLKAYAAKRISTKGIKTKSDGEWEDKEIEHRSMEIVGDVVEEWVIKTRHHFGGPVKTLMFSASVAHGEELCRHLQKAGYNFQQVSYKDGNDASRRALIDEFRKDNSEIVGLVSVECLAKGFDVPSVLCGVDCKPYRKSFSGFIQKIGRVMRPCEEKTYALWNCHCGNMLGWYPEMIELFANGVSSLDSSDLDNKVRKEPEERPQNVCACGFILSAGDESCPSCGKERPKRKNHTQAVAGEMIEVGKHAPKHSWMQNPIQVQRELLGYALASGKRTRDEANRYAYAMYLDIIGGKPPKWFPDLTPAPTSEPVHGAITHHNIKFRHRNRRRR